MATKLKSHMTPPPFPELRFSDREREISEYKTIDERLISLLVHSYLVDGLAFRSMDDICLDIFSRYPDVTNRGYKSQSILSYLGLWKGWKGYFKDSSPVTVLDAVQKLVSYETDDAYKWRLTELYRYLLGYYRTSGWEEQSANVDLGEKAGKIWISEVLLSGQSADNFNERLKLLSGHNNYKITLDSTVRYYSNKVLKEAIKDLYDFRCQVCDDCIYRKGWDESLSRKEKWEYMSADVHHIHPLSSAGPDIAENMICLCPSCHRKFHSGEYRLVGKHGRIICNDEILGRGLEMRILHTIDLSL